MGKKNWNITEISPKFVSLFKQKYPSIPINEPVNIDLMVQRYYYNSLDVIANLYVSEVIDEKVEWNVEKKTKSKKLELAIEQFENTKINPADNFYELPIDEQNRRIDQITVSAEEIDQIRTIEIQEATRIANLTVQRIVNLEKEGKIKSPYNAAQIFLHLTEVPPKQEEYLVDSEYEKWLSSYYDGEIPKKNDGSIDREALENIEIEVYCFQCGDLGANNFMKFGDDGGNIGAKDGMFVITKKDYEELLRDTTMFDANGKCINIPKLSARLGNVPLGTNPICIKQAVKLSQLETSHGGKSTAYFGEFGPPLSTQGGYDENGNYIEGKPEAIVPQTNFIVNGQINPNIEIISHSKNMTTAELMQIAQIYLSKSEQFRGRDDISMDHWSLTDGLDKDIEILRKFKETLTKEEQKYLSQLMVHLQIVMQREEVNTAGKGAM